MLKNQYDVHIIGHNYISLIHGIKMLKDGKSTLLVNDPQLPYANKWFLNIGYGERAFLSYLGKELEVEALEDVDSFLTEQNSLLYLNQKLFEFSDSPFLNIKEMARKLPDCFGELFETKFADLSAEEFNQEYFDFQDILSSKLIDRESNQSYAEILKEFAPANLKLAVEHFIKFVEMDTVIAKQIHFVVQVMYQTVFSSQVNSLETAFLFLSLISPRFQVEGEAFAVELLYEYRKLGGDLKDASIKDWGVRDNNLEYVQLNSIDGNIKVDSSYLFAQSNFKLPFEPTIKRTPFRSISIECKIDHQFINYFRNKRVVFAPQNRMGSDFPFWEISIEEDGQLIGIYSYADYQGTKPSFYYPSALDDVFSALKLILPGLNKSDWVSRARLSKGYDVWFEFQPEEKDSLSPDLPKAKAALFSKVQLRESQKELTGMINCGPERARSLGLYSYFLEVFSD